MEKKFLRKNEFRFDINPSHLNNKKEPHPAYITARRGHKYRANSITHARVVDNINTFIINENPNYKSKDKRPTRLSKPFWQSSKMFSKEKLSNFKFSRKARRKISKFNKKFK